MMFCLSKICEYKIKLFLKAKVEKRRKHNAKTLFFINCG